MRRPVVFENEKQQIFGVLHYPPDARKLPAVLLCHGFTGTKVESHRIFVKLAQRLEEQGLVALRFDFRGSGDSEGDFSQMTLESEIADARAALHYLQSLPEVHPNRIGILGFSMGGAVAATLSGRDPRISACALWSAVADFSQTFFSQAAKEVIEQGKPDLDFGGNVVSRQFLLECQKARPNLELARRCLPVLIVHGTEDQTVPVSHADLFREAAESAGSPVELQKIAGADHTYSRRDWEEEVLEVTGSWLAGRLR